MTEMQLFRRKFVVNEKPYCAWMKELPGDSLQYLRDIDPMYFLYLRNVHAEKLETQDKMSAAIALRTTYVQSLETFFALLFSALQAPHCIRGWLVKYEPGDLPKLIEKVNSTQPVLTYFHKDKPISWDNVSKIILGPFKHSDKEIENKIRQFYSDLWEFFAGQYTDEMIIREYNSIKHGLRIIPGGFLLRFKAEDKQADTPSESDWIPIADSEYGSRYPICLPLRKNQNRKDKINFKVNVQHLNWSPEFLCKAIELICGSISCVIEYLKIVHHADSSEVRFIEPANDNVMADLIKLYTAETSTGMSWDYFDGDDPELIECSSEEVLQQYKKPEKTNY